MPAKKVLYDDICYKNPFLESVVVRIDFSSPVEIFDEKLSADFESSIIKEFPIPEPHRSFSTQLKINKGKMESTHSEGPPTWVFHSKNKDRKFELSRDHFALSFKKYTSYEELEGIFKKYSSKIFDIDKNLVANRIGIRYINIIKINDNDKPYNFDKYINKKLLHAIKVPKDIDTLARAFTNVIMNHEEVVLQAQFGIFNPDFPSRIKKKEFVLDIDAYYIGLVENEDVLERISTFHKYIQEFFEDSITDETRKRMDG